MDAKGIPTTVFMPCLGKLGDKDSVLKKAMKTLFTNAWANYEIGKSIDENAELAAETAADALADDVEVAEDAPNSEAAPAAETKAEDTKADPKAAAPAGKMDKLKSDVEALEALLESMKGNSDASKHGEMDAQFKSLVGDIQKKK